jgi:Ca-activated chloride channel homolog
MIDQFRFLNPSGLLFLWLPFVVFAFGLYRRVTVHKIVTMEFSHFLKERAEPAAGKIYQLIILTTAMLLAVLAIARPSWEMSEIIVSKEGRDVVFVIDVSQSMLAEDLYPNRLERAKLAVLDALSAIENDRVALVAFAGTSVVKCPLTLDYSFFKQAVAQLAPDAVSRGGSMIGDALRKTIREVLKENSAGYQDIILITDGEDQESYPIQAAELLGENQIRLIAIGLGDENTGKRIPITDDQGATTYLTYNGQEIWTRLDAETLRKMVLKTDGGQYLNVSTGAFDMGEIYSALIKSQETTFIEDDTAYEFKEQFQLFLAPAIILFIIYLFIFSTNIYKKRGKQF